LYGDASSARDRSRCVAILAVIALHLAVIAALVLASRFGEVLRSSTVPLEIMFLPPKVIPSARVLPTSERALRDISPALSPSPPALEPAPPGATLSQSDASIDWTQEAEHVAAVRAEKESRDGSTGSVVASGSKSPFAPPPAHRAGDEFTAASGERAVYVSETCYQVATPFTKSPNGIDNGMGTQTYCNGPSHTARGDLFDQLPAYKKLHPAN